MVNNETMNNHSHHGNIGHQLKDINNSIQVNILIYIPLFTFPEIAIDWLNRINMVYEISKCGQ